MRSPYSLSRTSLVVTPGAPRRRVGRTRKANSRIENPVLQAQLEPEPPLAELNSVAADPNVGKSEYEHWENSDISGHDGCRSACSNGTETIAAFGDVVSEVFDLINEVAFPGVIDTAANAEGREANVSLNGESYNEDDDSIFVRSRSYEQGKHAKDFLDFIGAARPKSQKIVTTPIPSPDLLSPSGTTLNLPPQKKEFSMREISVSFDSRVDDEKEDEPRDEPRDEPIVTETKSTYSEHRLQTQTTDSLDQHNGDEVADRYCSVISSDGSNDLSEEEEEEEKMSEAEYKQYIKEILYSKEKQKAMANSSMRFHFGTPQSLSSVARKKHGIIHRFKNLEQSELLAIAESSYEDESDDDYEDVEEELRDHALEEEYVQDDSISSGGSESTYSSFEEQHDGSSVDYSTASSVDSYESAVDSTRHTRYSVELTESMLETDEEAYEDESITRHTKSLDGEDYESVTRHMASAGTNESSFEYDEEDYDESVSQHILPFESNEDVENSQHSDDRLASVAESLLEEEDDEEVKYNKDHDYLPNSVPGTSRFCSVYDNLYPTDSIFSFATHDEATEKDTLFDFDEDAAEQDEDLQSTVIIPDVSLSEDVEETRTNHEEIEEYQEEQQREQEQEDERIEASNDVDRCDGKNNGMESMVQSPLSETREGIEEDEGREQNESVSRVSSTFSAVVYGETINIKSAKAAAIWPRRRSPTPQSKAPLEANADSESVEETSSNNSVSSSGSCHVDTEQTPANDNKTNAKTIMDRRTMKRRAFERVRKFNQHRESAIKFQQKAE